MKKARLLSAYFWNCEDCAAENFERSQVMEFVDDAEREEVFRRFHDLPAYCDLPDGWRDFQVVTSQDLVVCKSCGHTFETEDDREEP